MTNKREGEKWTREECILALDIYLNEEYSSKEDEVIQDMAELVGRSPSSIGYRLANYQYLDSEGEKGLSGTSQLCEEVWNNFHERPDKLNEKASEIASRMEEDAFNKGSNSKLEIEMENELTRHFREHRGSIDVVDFSGYPDHWLTALEYGVWGLDEDNKNTWSRREHGSEKPGLDEDDIVLFRAQGSVANPEIEDKDSKYIGAGIVGDYDDSEVNIKQKNFWWTEFQNQEWWDEHRNEDKREWNYLVQFKKVFMLGDSSEIDFRTSIEHKTDEKIGNEVDALLKNGMDFGEANNIRKEVSDKNIFAQGSVTPFRKESDSYKNLDTGFVTALMRRMSENLEEIPSINVHKDIPDSDFELKSEHLGNLHFPSLDKEELTGKINSALRSGKHLIFTGPPGTGKTEIAKSVSEQLANQVLYIGEGATTTATSDWSTFDTVGGYMPATQSDNLIFKPGQFLRRFKDNSEQHQINQTLIVDEINRSNIDKAFGQLFTVLSGQKTSLPYEENEIEISLTPAQEFELPMEPSEYIIPQSWRLLATMNTYDKTSLYEMSYAFMRRFARIRVESPDIPDKKEKRISMMEEYLDAWDMTEQLEKEDLEDIALLWKQTQKADENGRDIGPAIIKDIATHIRERKHLDEEPKNSSSDKHAKWMTEALYMYIVPQLEGVKNAGEIMDDIGELKFIDEEEAGRFKKEVL